MIADFEFTFSQHDETIRRAESNARLLAQLSAHRSAEPTTPDRPQRRLSTLLPRHRPWSTSCWPAIRKA